MSARTTWAMQRARLEACWRLATPPPWRARDMDRYAGDLVALLDGTRTAVPRLVTATDRTFRALAREQPSIVLSLLRAAGMDDGALDEEVRPEEVGDPHVDRPAAALEADSVVFVGARVFHTELQGYSDPSFEERLFRYHVHLTARHWPLQVHTLAVWLLTPTARNRVISRGALTLRISSLVVRDVSPKRWLSIPGAACFAAGSRAGRWSERFLCDRVVDALREQGASARVQQMAVLVAHRHSVPRYVALRQAMRRARMPDVILEDFVKIGEEIGEERGLKRGLEQGLKTGRAMTLTHQFSRRLGRPLTDAETRRLLTRLDRLGPDRLGDVVLDLDPAALARWLANPRAK